MIGLVGQLAARWPQVALPGSLGVFRSVHGPMGTEECLVGQLAARRPQVALPRRLPIG